ncbi:MAG: low temperature requirement protein A, partial [Actinobacteria bacterium]|nr:low temperature requirement protein A [Actinomycetota bacterium]
MVFVVAVAQLAGTLSADPTLGGFLEFAGLFAPIWWAWVGFTFYADRFDTDDVVHRLLVLAGMFGMATLAVQVPGAAGETARAFTVAYLVVRGLVIVLNARAWRHVPPARPMLTAFISGFTLGWLLWASSLLVGGPARYWLWAAGTAIEIGTPLVSRRVIQAAPIHASHIPERMGLFIIIVLGESVLAVVVGVS